MDFRGHFRVDPEMAPPLWVASRVSYSTRVKISRYPDSTSGTSF